MRSNPAESSTYATCASSCSQVSSRRRAGSSGACSVTASSHSGIVYARPRVTSPSDLPSCDGAQRSRSSDASTKRRAVSIAFDGIRTGTRRTLPSRASNSTSSPPHAYTTRVPSPAGKRA